MTAEARQTRFRVRAWIAQAVRQRRHAIRRSGRQRRNGLGGCRHDDGQPRRPGRSCGPWCARSRLAATPIGAAADKSVSGKQDRHEHGASRDHGHHHAGHRHDHPHDHHHGEDHGKAPVAGGALPVTRNRASATLEGMHDTITPTGRTVRKTSKAQLIIVCGMRRYRFTLAHFPQTQPRFLVAMAVGLFPSRAVRCSAR